MYSEVTEFVEYCLDFYGPNGLYDYNMTEAEILFGLSALLLTRPEVEFEGDSRDRENVRDIVLEMRGEL